ncbi:replication initiator protein [Capybara microvirus Cap1_SP_175]|nr:replication initiator protein [Capybara microvirus Cap1_SP_175]
MVIIRKNGMIKKDGSKGTATSQFTPANSPNFKGYEYYEQINKKLKENNEEYEWIRVPCGNCLACKIQKSKEWAIRLECEAKQYETNYFLTLTYDEEHKPYKEIFEYNDKKYYDPGTWNGYLIKEDAIRFLNSFRKYCSREYKWDGIRFYMVGEYGSLGQRPHYHAILLNCPKLKDLKPIGSNRKTKDAYLTSERIEHIWGKGFITIGEVTWQSMLYVAGYCQKKLNGSIGKELYARAGQTPPFANMSRKPGIGKYFFDENKIKIYDCDEIINSKGLAVKPPQYYDKMMEKYDKELMENIKERRKIKAKNYEIEKMKKTTLNIKEQMEVEERTKIEKLKRYNRNRIADL